MWLECTQYTDSENTRSKCGSRLFILSKLYLLKLYLTQFQSSEPTGKKFVKETKQEFIEEEFMGKSVNRQGKGL